MSIDLSKLLTERRNANSANIDTLSTEEMLTVINQEDQQVAHAITPYLPQIARWWIRSRRRCRPVVD
jgi:N-acetylmuramic acid 6-phosphate etherase